MVTTDDRCYRYQLPLASIPPQNDYYWLYNAFKELRFEWLISNEIMTEHEEKITNKYSLKTAELVLSILSVAQNAIFDEPYFKWSLITQDADDNKFADLAIAGNAYYLVTNDKHYNILKVIEFPKVNIVTLNEFKNVLFG